MSPTPVIEVFMNDEQQIVAKDSKDRWRVYDPNKKTLGMFATAPPRRAKPLKPPEPEEVEVVKEPDPALERIEEQLRSVIDPDEHQRLHERVVELEKSCVIKDGLIAGKVQELEEEKAKVRRSEEKLAAVQIEVDRLADLYRQVEGSARASETQASDLASRLQARNDELVQAQVDIGNATARITVLERELATAEADKATLLRERDQAQTERAAMEVERDAARAAQATAERDRDAARAAAAVPPTPPPPSAAVPPAPSPPTPAPAPTPSASRSWQVRWSNFDVRKIAAAAGFALLLIFVIIKGLPTLTGWWSSTPLTVTNEPADDGSLRSDIAALQAKSATTDRAAKDLSTALKRLPASVALEPLD